tara:strand:- start:157 stop:738 length:582 start_codon:yes stop_codon:yes gene_type:complete
VKPVKCKHFGKEYRYPYVLEEDFMVDDLIQKHKDSILSEFYNEKLFGSNDNSNNIKYLNKEFNKKISDMFIDVIKKNFSITNPTNEIEPFIYIQDKDYGHYQMHNHIAPTPSVISATCYTDIPEKGGNFRLYLGSDFGESPEFKPEINKLYMFPGWLYHSPTPQKSEKPRICINLDYCSMMKPKIKDKEWIIW